MVYINIIRDSEYYEDDFEEIIATKTNCSSLIQEAIRVFYGDITDFFEDWEEETMEQQFQKLLQQIKESKCDEKIINYLIHLGADEVSCLQDDGVLNFVESLLDYYDERVECVKSYLEM